MKKIEAIVRLSKFQSIRENLKEIGVRFFTMQEVRGIGLQEGDSIKYRGSKLDADYISRLKLDIVVSSDQKVKEVIDVILATAKTGHVGDGKIFIYNIEESYRIRTGEKGSDAL